MMLPDDARVITLFGGSPTILYHTHRKGWSSWPDLEEIKRIKTRADGDGIYIVGTKEKVKNISDSNGFNNYELFLEEDDLICLKI